MTILLLLATAGLGAGVFGSLLGLGGGPVRSHVAQRIDRRLLRLVFAAVMALTAIRMALRALG